jgi:hypothetical protein
MTAKNADGSNCQANTQAQEKTSGMTPVQPSEMYSGITPFNTSTVLIPPPIGNVTSSMNNQAPVNTCGCPTPPPCPACARCPEPSFECKKVPNYKSSESQRILPQAVLTDFSSFGM